MPTPTNWTANGDTSFTYFPAAMRIGGKVVKDGEKYRATTHQYWNDRDNRAPSIPMDEPSEVFDKLEDAMDWLERKWAAARRQAGLS